MGDGQRRIRTVVALLGVTVAVSAIVALLAVAVWGLVILRDVESDLPDTLEDNINDHVDAGFVDPGLRGDDPLLGERKILLGHDINAHTAKDVADRLLYLDALDDAKPIDLYIATLGGWADNAFTIIDVMRTIHAPVNTWAVGGCYSSGALILAAGTGRRRATDNAIIMVHANLDDSSEPYSVERLELARYENVWRRTAKLPEEWFPMTSGDEYYLTADEALRLGIVDEVVHTWPGD